MKYKKEASIVVLFLIVGLLLLNTLAISGSGRVITEDIKIRSVASIEFNGIGNLYITQGESEGLIIEAEDNILPHIQTTIVNETLHIYVQERKGFLRLRPSVDINYYVTVKDLDSISYSGKGHLEVNPLTTESIEVRFGGVGTGAFEISAKTIDLDLAGSGDFTLKGTSMDQRVSLSGDITYDAQEHTVSSLSMRINGAANGLVNVLDTITVDINGHGDLQYLGEPSLKERISINGSGSITKYEN